MKAVITMLFCILSISSFAQLVNNSTITLNDASIYSDDLEFQLNGPVNGNGTLTSPSIIVNNQMSPGLSVGTITINDNLTLTTNSQLIFEIEGDAGEGVNGGNDLIVVEESLQIDGELVVDVPNSFVPDASDRFTLITYDSAGSVTGTFETITLDPVFNGWNVSYGQLTPGLIELAQDPLLPVKLVEFTATKVGTSALLEWITASEINNAGFHVQHSINGIEWVNIGWVEGAGDSSVELNYSFIHENPSNGENFYRIQQVDFNGDSEYSTVELLNFDEIEFFVFPNPAQNELFIQVPFETNSSVSIVDNMGQVLKNIDEYQSSSPINISNLEIGSYILILKNEEKTLHTIFIKQ